VGATGIEYEGIIMIALSTRRDKYLNFNMLRRLERNDDFRIDCHIRPSTVAIIAPHGGKIEPGTSTIAAAIAGDDYSLYRFEGTKPRDNCDLHITSTNFDEPQCLTLLSGCDYVVAIHGCRGEEQVVYMGGLDLTLREAIQNGLDEIGVLTGIHDDPDLRGIHPKNICNKGRRRQGVQLEISYGLRVGLGALNPSKASSAFSMFAAAVGAAIDSVLGSPPDRMPHED
jgi:phage replication-related protein YjqB (UPF0714/DUF867 family)